jgi:hypothetical protein
VRKILYPEAEEILTIEEQEEYLDELLSAEELEQII